MDASEVAEFGEGGWGSGAGASEVEIVSFDDEGGLVVVDDLVEEGLGVFGEEGWGRGEFDDFIGSGFEETLAADFEGFDLGGRDGGVEGGEGVWVEGEGDEAALRGDCGACVLEEELVTLVDAVEVANCKGGGEGGLVLVGIRRIGHGGVYQGGVR